MGRLRSDCELQSMTADFGQGAVEVYWREMSLKQVDKIDQARKKSDMAGLVECLVLRSLDEHGMRMFDQRHSESIWNQFDPDEVIRVVAEMNKQSENPVDP